jgi:hypothetical protein
MLEYFTIKGTTLIFKTTAPCIHALLMMTALSVSRVLSSREQDLKEDALSPPTLSFLPDDLFLPINSGLETPLSNNLQKIMGYNSLNLFNHRYVRDLSKADLQTMNFITKISTDIANDHRYEFQIPSSAYLHKENTLGDSYVTPQQERDLHGRHEDGEDGRTRQ